MSKIIATGAGWNELFEEAREALQRRALDDAECALSLALDRIDGCKEDDPRLAATLNLLARVNAQQGRFDTAIALLERLLDVQETSLGARHPQLAGVLSNLAEMYAHTGALAQELSMRKRVYDIRSVQPGSDPAIIARLSARIAELRAKLVSSTGASPVVTPPKEVVVSPASPTTTPSLRPMLASTSSSIASMNDLNDRYSGLEAESSESFTSDSTTPVTLWHRSPSLVFTPLSAAPVPLSPAPRSRLADWRIRVAGAGALAATVLLTVMASRGSSTATSKADSTANARTPATIVTPPAVVPAPVIPTTASTTGARDSAAGDVRDATRRGSAGDVARESNAQRTPAEQKPAPRPEATDARSTTTGAAASAPVDVDRLSRSFEDAMKRIDASNKAMVDSLNKAPAVAPTEFRKQKLSEPRRP